MKRWQWLAIAILIGVVVRGPFWIEALRTPVDGDTAIVGLMSEHPFASTTMWGQPYGSPLDAWVALPFVALLGHTVAALRLPVFLLSLGLIPLAWLLASRLHREAALPAALLVACPPAYFLLLSALPPPFYATTLVLAGLSLWLGLLAGDALSDGRKLVSRGAPPAPTCSEAAPGGQPNGADPTAAPDQPGQDAASGKLPAPTAAPGQPIPPGPDSASLQAPEGPAPVALSALSTLRCVGLLALWGAVSGLALWTHMMSASAVVASGAWILLKGRRRPVLLLAALLPLLVTCAPFWRMALAEREATRIVKVSGRESSTAEHLTMMLPRLHEPLGAVLGTHVPMVADAEDAMVRTSPPLAAGLVLVWGFGLIFAVRRLKLGGPAGVLLFAAAIAVIAFPLPLRSAPHTIRFLTPLFLPLAVVVVSAPAVAGRSRRSLVLALALAALQLPGGVRLLDAWRHADRAAAPFLLPDLAPVRQALLSRGIRHAYAAYSPAWRLTWESSGAVVASQPWNERFRHWPLPLLDEVRFSHDVAWVLVPGLLSDLPSADELEAALRAQGGRYRRTTAGAFTVLVDFTPPWSPQVEPLAGAGAAGDGNVDTSLSLDMKVPTLFRLDPPRRLAGLTLVAPIGGPTLLRSMDVEVSADGETFEVMASRRRRQEREDLRWVNGHPQYVLDHDLLPVPLGGRTVAALRLTPVLSGDPWALAEVLLHPATDEPTRPWDDWLSPNLDWPERKKALRENPRPDREDWYARLHLASRR